MMFDPEQLHHPKFRTRVQEARAFIAERVRRGTATPAEHLAGAVLDEMPSRDDPGAVRAWALRSAAVATLARYVGIVETFADEGWPRRRRDDALTETALRKPRRAKNASCRARRGGEHRCRCMARASCRHVKAPSR